MKLERISRDLTHNFTVISNTILMDARLSFRAKGLHTAVMSLPANWDFSIAGMAATATEGRDAVYTALQELIDCGYVVKIEHRSHGRFQGNEYRFHYDPQNTGISPHTEKPYTEKPYTDKPYTANPHNKESIVIKNEIDKEHKRSVESGDSTACPEPQLQTPCNPSSSPEQEVFDYWKLVLNHPSSRLDEKRRARLRARLRDGFAPADLKRVVDVVARDPFYMGKNARNRRYDGIETIFRDRAQVERFLEMADAATFKPDTHWRSIEAEIESRAAAIRPLPNGAAV